MNSLKRSIALAGFILSALLAVASPAAAAGDTTCFDGTGQAKIDACTRLIRNGQNLSYAYNGRCWGYHLMGDDIRAIPDCDKAIQIDPRNVYAWNNRGACYDVQGNNEHAIADYTEAIRIDPDFAWPYANRGAIYYWKMGDAAKARADFNAALRTSPEHQLNGPGRERARTNLAKLPAAPAPATEQAAARPTPPTAILSLSSGAISAGSDDRRIALVIGNSAYENVPALPNPERDAKLVADVLKRIGFQSVTLLTNLKKEALVSALRNFASQAEAADWAVIYYAGHGMEVGGTNYLVPIDATIAADRDVGFEAVPLEQVLNVAERAKKLRLVVLDACRDNPFKARMKRTLTVASRSVTSGLAAIEPEAGTLVVYAAKDGQQASDGDGLDSPFALAFVKNVQTPGLELRRLFDVVRDDVMDMTSRQQQPFSYGSISGRRDFYFVATK